MSAKKPDFVGVEVTRLNIKLQFLILQKRLLTSSPTNQSHQAMEPMAAATSQMSSTARVRLRPARTSRCDR